MTVDVSVPRSFHLIEEAEISSLYDRIPVCPKSTYDSLVDDVCDSFPTFDDSDDKVMDSSIRLLDDPIADNISSINPLLCEEEFERRISDLELKTSVGLAAGAMHPNELDDDSFIFNKIGDALSVGAATISAVVSGKQDGVTADHLSKIWRISYEDADRTLRSTTQLLQHSVHGTLSRNIGTSDRALRYRRLKSTFYMDTLIVGKGAHSVRGYKYIQVFVSDRGFVYIYLMSSLTEIPTALKRLAALIR